MKHKLLQSSDKHYLEFEIEIIRETDKAILISDGMAQEWIPKSQLEDDPEKQANGLYFIIIPEWLAIDKGLI